MDLLENNAPHEILQTFQQLLSIDRMQGILESAASNLPNGKVICVGHSAQKRPLLALRAGNLDRTSLYIGGVHAMEGITSLLLLHFLQKAAQITAQKGLILGLRPEIYWNRAGLFVLPCLNPDGIALARSGWQANARGVDLNHNFDADWAACKASEAEMGITVPGPTKYGGKTPFSEPESRAVKRLCCRNRFSKLITFHSQGEEIYAGHGGNCSDATRSLGELMAKFTGYRLCEPDPSAAHGGLKDWFYDRFDRPAYTLEIGKGSNPLPADDLDGIYAKLAKLLFLFPLL